MSKFINRSPEKAKPGSEKKSLTKEEEESSLLLSAKDLKDGSSEERKVLQDSKLVAQESLAEGDQEKPEEESREELATDAEERDQPESQVGTEERNAVEKLEKFWDSPTKKIKYEPSFTLRDGYECDGKYGTIDIPRMRRMFANPVFRDDFASRLGYGKVCLEVAECSNARVIGSIAVSNLEYVKEVTVHYAMSNEWKRKQTFKAIFMEHVAETNTDRFAFRFYIWNVRESVQFYITYKTPNCGAHSDNNLGCNYAFERRKISSISSASPGSARVKASEGGPETSSTSVDKSGTRECKSNEHDYCDLKKDASEKKANEDSSGSVSVSAFDMKYINRIIGTLRLNGYVGDVVDDASFLLPESGDPFLGSEEDHPVLLSTDPATQSASFVRNAWRSNEYFYPSNDEEEDTSAIY